MNPPQLSLALSFICFIITFNVVCSDSTLFTDDTVSINCGSSGTSSAYSGSKWLGYVQPRASPLLKLTGSSTTSAAKSKMTSADPVPYKTARLSRSQFSYELQVNPGLKLLEFDLDHISAATDNFSSSNIVGRDKFNNTVYKAVFPSGEVVAVRSWNPLYSAQALEEFKNVINVLPNLQHPNIIKLHGYCIHGEDVFLVYEFIENDLHLVISKKTSSRLDHYIDKGQEQHLEWGVRFQIIMGIARGLVYLHHDTGLRVIHRDLNLSNILLDPEMNPKIIGFELARELELNHSERETFRVVGTYGYMSPEYYYGKISVKADVYSFGIVLLRIVSGVATYYLDASDFLANVWKLWTEGRVIDFMDNSLLYAFGEDEVIRCIQVALLCIQERPDQRPLMSSVIKMLEGNEEMMQPQTPAFVKGINNLVDGVDSNATFEFDDTLER